MRKLTLIVLGFFLYGTIFSQTVIFEDNFESYSVGQLIASQSTYWETWTNANGGGADDAAISSTQSVSGTKSLNITNGDDIVYKFGSKTAGHYQVSFNFYINTGAGGYINFEHAYKTNFAFDLYFTTNGNAIFDNNSDSLVLFTYSHNQWNNIIFDINLEQDSVTILLNNVAKGTYKYSKSTNSTPSITLDCITFYGVNSALISNTNWYIDDFKFTNQLSSINIASSNNVYSFLVEHQSSLSADQSTGLITFTHRGKIGDNGCINSGDIMISQSRDNGANWTQLMSFPNVSGLNNRYPSGVIYNPIGNTNPDNAYVITAGPVHDGDDWNKAFLGSMKMDSTNINRQYLNTYGAILRNGMVSTTNGKVHIMGASSNTTTGKHDTTYLFTGTFNSTSHIFNWTTSKFTPSFVTNTNGSDFAYISHFNTAWSSNGVIGYYWTLGRDVSNDTRSYQPIVWKTTNSGSSWAKMSVFDFATLGVITNELQAMQGVSPTASRPRFSDKTDGVVDANGQLHLISQIKACFSNNNDSLGYYHYTANTTNNSNPIFDVYTTSTGWAARLMGHTYTLDVDASESGFGSIYWNARLQAGKTADGTKIFASWADSDTTIAPTGTSGLLINKKPNIIVSAWNISTNKQTLPTNISSGVIGIQDSCYFHYMSDIILSNNGTYNVPLAKLNLGTLPVDIVDIKYIRSANFTDADFNLDNLYNTTFPFVEQTGITIAGSSYNSNVAWGDYDNDGDLDILVTGNSTSKIYKNNGFSTSSGWSFIEQTGISIIGISSGSSEWGDYDNDGYFDILITGKDTSNNIISKVYKNNGNNSFTLQTGISLIGVQKSAVAWGDYDNDGDLDLLITGLTASNTRTAKVYKNMLPLSPVFTEQTSIVLDTVRNGSINWADYDNDGYLDILITGHGGSVLIASLYKNNGDNSFTKQINTGLEPIAYGSVDWGDYDNDGDLDLIMMGSKYNNGWSQETNIYKNNSNNTFTKQTGISLTGAYSGSAVWGDYNNDGNLDILLAGASSAGRITKVYRSNGNNSFTELTGSTLDSVGWGDADWGDYDNDGDLDILLNGSSTTANITKIYKNTGSTFNTAPTAPTNLSTVFQGDSIAILSWNKSTDTQTPQNGLSYNIRIGTTSNGIETTSPQANISTGYRRIIKLGNAQKTNSYTLKIDPSTQCANIYWSVQAIDNAFAGSLFSTEQLAKGSDTSSITVATCGTYISPSGKSYTNSGIYIDTIPTVSGCDSIITTNLTINPPYVNMQNNSICDNDSLLWRGAYYSSTGLFSDTLTTIGGCDSILQLDLILNSTYLITVANNVCSGDSLFWHNSYYSTTGIYYDSLNTINGCDSIFQLSLTVNLSYLINETNYICSGDSLLWHNNYYSITGIYYDSLNTTKGCDSVFQFNLTINPSYLINETNYVCNGDSILWHNSYYSTTGIYYDSLNTINGCDSILQFDLIVNPTYLITIANNVCNGDSLFWHNSYYTSSGTYYDSLNTTNGCDSVYKLNLSITPIYSFTEYDTICSGDTLNWHGKTLFTSGIHYDSLNTTYGCDSVFIMSLNLKTLPIASITANGATTFCNGLDVLLQANSGTFNYSWEKDGIALSAYQSTYLAGQGGNYSVIVTDTSDAYACSNQSNIIAITVNSNNYNISFTANPTLFTAAPYFTVFYNQTVNASNYSWKWLFGDGTISMQQAPSHTYNSFGTYSVSAIATNANTGCTDTMTYSDFITCTGSNPCGVIAGIFPAGPITICANDSFLLQATGNAPTYTYQWMYNGVQINGATDSVYWATNVGTYKLKVTDTCSNYSADFILYKYPNNTPLIQATGSIQPCSNDSMNLFTTGNYNSYLWSTGQITNNIYVKTSGQYTLMTSDANNCTYTSLPYVVNTSLLATPEVCIVGVDSATNYNRIIYERQYSSLIDSFNIYRESNVANVYQKIGSLSYGTPGVFIDQNSNPAQQAYRYKISAVDSCGNETPLSNYHKTIHLTINAGMNNIWNLIWDGYDGFTFGSYKIYRGTDSLNMQLLTQIQSTLSSFTDLTPPTGNVYYQIEVISPHPCYPDSIYSKANTNFNSSRSNTANTSMALNIGFAIIDDIPMDFKVFPNPNQGQFVIGVSTAVLQKLELSIINNLGSIIFNDRFEAIGKYQHNINLQTLSKGMYYIRLSTDTKVVYYGKVIVN